MQDFKLEVKQKNVLKSIAMHVPYYMYKNAFWQMQSPKSWSTL